MQQLEVTKLSSKGQVVIPQKIREQMQLQEGENFIVFHEGDTIVLKTLEPPSFNNFDRLIAKARKFAKENKLKKSTIEDAIKSVRRKNKQ
ncbi:MAG: AbrB/MazE/SpoVT family DNA-binding domain-containing protein [Candidatus Hydrogenedentota bacterium]